MVYGTMLYGAMVHGTWYMVKVCGIMMLWYMIDVRWYVVHGI